MRTYSRREIVKKILSAAAIAVLPHQLIFPRNKKMLSRPIPSTGEKIPVIGLGTWIQFDVNSSGEEYERLREVLNKMLELGGRVIDSSPMYGRAEEVIGELTSGLKGRDDFFYATKVWTNGEMAGIEQMESSMYKMKRKVMDLIQVHNIVDWKTHLKTLRKWKEEGRIRYTGITHYVESAHGQLEEIIKSEKPDFVQFNYSIRVRNAERSLLDTARDNGTAVIINEPYEKGSLFRIVKGKALPEWVKEFEINSWGQFFLKFIISHPAVTCVIPGTSDPKHAEDNMKAGYGTLPDPATRKRMISFIENL